MCNVRYGVEHIGLQLFLFVGIASLFWGVLQFMFMLERNRSLISVSLCRSPNYDCVLSNTQISMAISQLTMQRQSHRQRPKNNYNTTTHNRRSHPTNSSSAPETSTKPRSTNSKNSGRPNPPPVSPTSTDPMSSTRPSCLHPPSSATRTGTTTRTSSRLWSRWRRITTGR